MDLQVNPSLIYPKIFDNKTSALKSADVREDSLLARFVDQNETTRLMLINYLSSNQKLDPLLEKTLTFIWIFFITTGLISNSILIIVIMFSRNLQSPNTLLLCNLFIADVTYSLLSMPFTLATILHRSWPLGTVLCKAVPFIQTNTAFVTAGTVTAIAIDRQYRIMCNSYRVHRISFFHPSYGLRMSISIWLFSMALSSPLLYFQRLETVLQVADFSLDICHEISFHPKLRLIYHSIVYGFFIFVPTLTLGISYIRIRSYLNYNGIEKRRQTYLLSSSGMNENQVSILIRKFDFLQKEITCNTKVTIILFMGILIYVISWLPLCLFNFYMDFFHSSLTASDITLQTIIFHVIATTSATTNAFIYGYLNTNIQKELSRWFDKLMARKCFY
ncbi:neuropeptide Y receptor type 1-like [Panonychus citri]|uniref:neuropeptide Y receptor type 1-like n=1 Tax=Panonychus citri TaxID=50023 RepID=UPI002308141F|nr:neuropeptide Y receptor type 1-like [Panonychus citri]